jgi:hypothetical protein
MQRRRSYAAFTIVVTVVMLLGAAGMGLVLLLSGAPGALVVGLVLALLPVAPLIWVYMWLDRYEPGRARCWPSAWAGGRSSPRRVRWCSSSSTA